MCCKVLCGDVILHSKYNGAWGATLSPPQQSRGPRGASEAGVFCGGRGVSETELGLTRDTLCVMCHFHRLGKLVVLSGHDSIVTEDV